MTGPRSSPVAFRGAVLVLWTLAFVLSANLGAMVLPDHQLATYAWFQAIAVVCLGAAFVLVCTSHRGADLPLPVLLGLIAVGFQVGAAWLLPPASVAPSKRMALVGSPDLRSLLLAAITALCGTLLMLDAARRISPVEQRVPLRLRLREARRSLTFNPLDLLFGPVFQKEVRVAGRHRATYWARALVPLLLIAIVGIAYAGMTHDMQHYAGAQRLQELQQLAPMLAMVLAWCQFSLLMFIAPVLTSSGICEERRARTLPALMTTPMTSAQIIGGKLTSRLVQIIILALAGAPLLLGVRIFGGLEARIVVATTAVTVSASVLAAALGLMYSIWHRRAATAAIFGLLTMVAFALVPICIMAAAALRAPAPPAWLTWVFALSAPVAMFGITASIFAPGGMGLDLEAIWITNSLVNLFMAGAVALFSTLALRKVLRAEAAGALATSRPTRRQRRRPSPAEPAPADAAPTESDELAGDSASHDEPMVLAAYTRSVGDQPVLWREIRQAAFGSRNKLIALAAVVALGLGWLYWYVGLKAEADTINASVAIIVSIAVCLHAALTTTAAIAGERESRTWDVLLTTPLTPLEIVSGKFLGGLRRQWFTLAVLAVHCAICLAVGAIHPLTVFHLFAIVVATTVFLNGSGVLLSMVLRRSTAAAVCNVGLALGLWIALPIAIVFFTEVIGSGYGGGRDDFMSAVLSINPVAMAAIATEGSSRHRLVYHMPHSTMAPSSFTALLLFTSFLGAAAGLGSAMLAVSMFPRRSGRIS